MTRAELDIREWLLSLAVRCTPRTAENIEAISRDYATSLVDFPREVFCPASREEASRAFDSFPPYKALRGFLEKWWSENRPRPKALGGPDAAVLNDEEQYWVRSWQRHRSGDWGTAKDGTPHIGSQKHLRFELELMKNSHPEAFRWLVLHDKEAARIAALAGWSDGPALPATDKEREAVALATRRAVAAIQRANIPKQAGAVDQQQLLAEAAREEFRKKNGRYPGQLSQEQLERLREGNPILKRVGEQAA
jgi:hypothetical protein